MAEYIKTIQTKPAFAWAGLGVVGLLFALILIVL